MAELYAAVTAAASGDTIQLAAGTYQLTSAGGSLTLTKTLTLTGAGAGLTVIDGDRDGDNLADDGRVVTISGASVTATLSDLTIQRGGGGFSGCAINTSANLVLTRVNVLSSNCTGTANHGAVQAIGDAVLLTVQSSTFAANTVAGFGGGLALANGADAILTNSTIHGNTATFGGGVYADDGLGSDISRVAINNSTITGNSASATGAVGHGGGIYTYFADGSSFVALANTIVAENTDAATSAAVRAPDLRNDDDQGAASNQLLSRGFNLIGSNTNCNCDLTNGSDGNLVGASGGLVLPGLGTLGLATGSDELQTRFPSSAGSTVLDAGNNTAGCTQVTTLGTTAATSTTAALTIDQRSKNRTAIGLTTTAAARCDIGAVEVQCGDGVVQTFRNETCDDGNADDTDDCTNTCILGDLDSDGSLNSADCDDTNAAIKPGAGEICNSVDDNCDGQADEGLTCDGGTTGGTTGGTDGGTTGSNTGGTDGGTTTGTDTGGTTGATDGGSTTGSDTGGTDGGTTTGTDAGSTTGATSGGDTGGTTGSETGGTTGGTTDGSTGATDGGDATGGDSNEAVASGGGGCALVLLAD